MHLVNLILTVQKIATSNKIKTSFIAIMFDSIKATYISFLFSISNGLQKLIEFFNSEVNF